MRTLIVEDEEHIREALVRTLYKVGHEAYTASTVEEANNLISEKKFDHAIIDFSLDNTSKFGGIEVYISAIQSNIHPIILSAYPFEYVVNQFKCVLDSTTESNKIIDDLKINYIDKGGEQIYIRSVLEKLGADYTQSHWYGNYHAILFAVQDYEIKSFIKNLHFPIKDAEKLKEILIRNYVFPPNNIKLMKNPSREEILISLDRLGKKLTSNDNLLIFFAGHGYMDKKRDRGYWIPSDASRISPANWISNCEIKDFIRGTNTRHTLLISDACFGGAILNNRGTSGISLNTQEKYKRKSRRAITSGSQIQTVPDQSIFLEYLINSLERRPSTGILYAEEVSTDITNQFIKNNISGQNPIYGTIQDTGDEIGGDFIFITKSYISR